MIELTLPAGSLQAALHAFAGGADAVYLGMQQFSARKGAINFSFEELAKLKQEAVRQDKRVYVTVNTLLDDRELDQAVPLFRQLELLRPDGIIVQDLGIASLLRREFPSLPIHSSTQGAVHTAEGVRMMQDLGFSRIVLSRELTFDAIARIRKECPDANLKVFIHGAMCYGFSGLCMASHKITGRSANRGECAQICRTWFSLEGEAGQEKEQGFFFSMTDLAAADDVLRLRDIGIDSLKVEGRMKSPAYVRFAARYYRMILDGSTDQEALHIAREELDTQFSRTSEGGWMFSYGKERTTENRHTPSLATVDYPSHTGTKVGSLRNVRTEGKSALLTITLDRDLSVRDGVLILRKGNDGLSQPVRFAVSSIRNREGRSLFTGRAHETVCIDAPIECATGCSDILYRVSRHDLHPAQLQEESLLPFRYPLDLTITIEEGGLTIRTDSLPSWMGRIHEEHHHLDIQRARTEQRPLENLIKTFSSAKEGFATLGSLEIINRTSWDDSSLFLPLSSLKETRRSWYASLHEKMQSSLYSFVPITYPSRVGVELPKRHLLTIGKDSHIPWVDPIQLLKQLDAHIPLETLLFCKEGWYYLPLPPVSFDEEALFGALDETIHRHGGQLRIGLNNIAHVRWAGKHPEVACFADIYLYMTNREAVASLLGTKANLIGLYHWVERQEMDMSGWPMTGSPAGPACKIPLFISRNCFRYDSLHLSCESCPRQGTWHVVQNGNRYRVDVRDCLTVVSEEPEEQ